MKNQNLITAVFRIFKNLDKKSLNPIKTGLFYFIFACFCCKKKMGYLYKK
jgi:hypothetical protein